MHEQKDWGSLPTGPEKTLIETILESPEEIEPMILSFIEQHDTESLSYLFLLGVNIFTFKTSPKLLFYPVLLFKLIFIHLFSRPIKYAQTKNAEEWTPKHVNCALDFHDDIDIDKLKKIIFTSPVKNLSMSDFTNLSDEVYFASLVFVLKKFGDNQIKKGAKLIDSIKRKPTTCRFADYIIDILDILQDPEFITDCKAAPLNIDLNNITQDTLTLGLKMHLIMLFCSVKAEKQLLLSALMMSYNPDSTTNKPTTIPEKVIFSVAPEFGQIQSLIQFYEYYLKGYHLRPSRLQPGTIIETFFNDIKNINLQWPDPRHHIQALIDLMPTINDELNIAAPLTIIIGLTNLAAGRLFYDAYYDMKRHVETSENPEAPPSPEIMPEFCAKNLIKISLLAPNVFQNYDAKLKEEVEAEEKKQTLLNPA